MCASTTVVYPCVIPRDTNKRKSDIPVMISPFRIGILFTKPIALRERAYKLKMPMAAMLPNKVDAVAASSAMVMVLTRAFIRE